MFIIEILILALTIYLYIVIASVIVSWMVMLQVLNIRNPIAKKINDFLTRATDPAYKRIQKILPPVGGFDFSPLVLLIGITLLQRFLYGL